MVSKKIFSSTTIFNIDNKKYFLSTKSEWMICEGSCDTEDLTSGVHVFVCSHGWILMYTIHICVLAWHLISHPCWEWYSCLTFFFSSFELHRSADSNFLTVRSKRVFTEAQHLLFVWLTQQHVASQTNLWHFQPLSITPWSLSPFISIQSLPPFPYDPSMRCFIFLSFFSQMLRLSNYIKCLCQPYKHMKHIQVLYTVYIHTHANTLWQIRCRPLTKCVCSRPLQQTVDSLWQAVGSWRSWGGWSGPGIMG